MKYISTEALEVLRVQLVGLDQKIRSLHCLGVDDPVHEALRELEGDMNVIAYTYEDIATAQPMPHHCPPGHVCIPEGLLNKLAHSAETASCALLEMPPATEAEVEACVITMRDSVKWVGRDGFLRKLARACIARFLEMRNKQQEGK